MSLQKYWPVLIAIAVATVVAFVAGSNSPPLATVGSSYWRLPDGYGLYALHGPGLRTAAFMAYLLFAALLGTLILAAFIEVESAALADTLRWLPLAGFIPGYFSVVAINRLVTFALPNLRAVVLLPLFYFLVAMCLAIASRRSLTRSNAALVLDGMLRFAATFIIFLILQVQVGNGDHVLGDGVRPFLEMIRSGTGLGPEEYFPIFVQHYDETMFLYPFFAPSGMAGEIVELFWMLYSMGKASAFACVMAALLLFSRRRMGSYLVSLLVFFGCLSLFDGKTLLLFDSGNPLRANLHIARVVLAVLPVVVLGLAISGRASVRRGTNAGLVGAFLVGAGISAASISSIVLLASVFVGLAILSLPIPVAAAGIGVLTLTALLLLAYSLRGNYGGPWLFLSGIATAFASTGYFAARHVRPRLSQLTRQPFFPAIFALTMGTALGLLALGNSFSYDYSRLLGFGETRKGIYGKSVPEFEIGFNPYCGRFPLLHCADIAAFFSSFGLVLMLAAFAVLVILWSARKALPASSTLSNRAAIASPDDRNHPELTNAIACSVLFLVAGFFAYDFTNGSVFGWLPVWIKSRLIEPWFYATLAFSSMALLMSNIRAIRVLMAFALTWQIFVYSFVLAETPIHLQFMRNGAFLLHKAIDR
ncbi:MAG: hypothetical protein M0Q22_02675 [Sulfuritalea sp.]|jgi:hypothetical protein|nr:hypothetical protein [Sulfuritalea sp.]